MAHGSVLASGLAVMEVHRADVLDVSAKVTSKWDCASFAASSTKHAILLLRADAVVTLSDLRKHSIALSCAPAANY